MQRISIKTVEDLKKAISILEQHKCIWNKTPIEFQGQGMSLAFIQESETISISVNDTPASNDASYQQLNNEYS
jgi:hypothetical protein